MQDLLDEKILRKKIAAAMEPKRQLLRPWAKDPQLDLHTMTEEYAKFGHRLEPHIADTARLVWDALDRDRLVIFEGAQGTLLDIDHGTYPFVTSSNPVAGAACVGAGVGPRDIDEVWGIAKAYSTRVGSGPFPSELDDELGERMREAGGEFGTTTGRPRRCGWIDLVALRYAARINGLTGLVITKLDVLTGIDPLGVAVRYLGPEGARFDEFPYHQSILHRATADLEELPGWEEDITGARSLDDLPQAARDYLDYISDFVGVPDRLHRRRPRPRPDHLDRGRQALRAARRGLGLDHARVHDEVVDRAVLVVPERPEAVEQVRHERDDRRGHPQGEALDERLADRRPDEVHRHAVRPDHPDPDELLAPGLAVALARAVASGAVRRGSPPRRAGPTYAISADDQRGDAEAVARAERGAHAAEQEDGQDGGGDADHEQVERAARRPGSTSPRTGPAAGGGPATGRSQPPAGPGSADSCSRARRVEHDLPRRGAGSAGPARCAEISAIAASVICTDRTPSRDQ